MHQAPHKAARITNGRGRRRALAEGDGLRSVRLSDAPQCGGRFVERRLPGDLLPAGIGVALRMSPAQRSRQTLRAIDKFRCGTAFGAQGGSGGVVWIRLKPGKAPVCEGGDSAAAGNAEAAKASNRLHLLSFSRLHACPTTRPDTASTPRAF